MNVFSLGPLYRILNLIKSIFGYIFRIVFWKKKKLDKDDGRIDNDKPIEIISIDQSGNRSSSLLEEQRGEMNVRQWCYMCFFKFPKIFIEQKSIVNFEKMLLDERCRPL